MADLPVLIKLVGDKIADIEKLKFPETERAARDFIAALSRDFGARCSAGAEYRLRLAGASSTCTSGHYGLLRNWHAAAGRKIAEAMFK